MVLVVMGVTSSGKSTVGALVARLLGWDFRDGDGFHPASNVAKMRSGQPLTDEDRRPWLGAIRAWMEEEQAAGRSGVVACSALRASHRAVLGHGEPWVRFAHLHGAREVIAGRMAHREGHFMPPSLLDSQFATLEPPADVPVFDVAATPEAIAKRVIEELGLVPASRPGPTRSREDGGLPR